MAKNNTGNNSDSNYDEFESDAYLHMTLGEVIKRLNDREFHPRGFHLFFVKDDLIRNLYNNDAEGKGYAGRLMFQTYDWRNTDPDKAIYDVSIPAKDVGVLGDAIQVYSRAMCSRYLEPIMNEMLGQADSDEDDHSKEDKEYVESHREQYEDDYGDYDFVNYTDDDDDDDDNGPHLDLDSFQEI